MNCISPSKHQIKLRINIQKPKSPKITEVQLNDDFLDRKQGLFFEINGFNPFFYHKKKEIPNFYLNCQWLQKNSQNNIKLLNY